jgi:SdpC family antimicrobial peptide
MMDNFWRSAILAATAAVAVGGVVTAVQLGGAGAQALEPAPQTLSSQDVFRAVVFGQGALAQQLGDQPSLRDFYRAGYAANNDVKQLAAADEVMQRISTADPSYFTRFAGAVRSGNPFVVSDALSGVPPVLQKVGLSTDDITEASQRTFMNFHFNQNVHTNINLVLNENAVINSTIWLTSAKPFSISDPFQRELAVGEIAATLRS